MKTLTAAATTAAARPYARPTYLLRLDFTVPSALTLYLSDQFYTDSAGQEWFPLVQSFGTLAEAMATVDVTGRPSSATVTFWNTKTVAGKSKLSDLIRSPLNLTGTYEFTLAKATVYGLIDRGGVVADEVNLGVYYVDQPEDIGDVLLTLKFSDVTRLVEEQMNLLKVTRGDWSKADGSVLNRVIPVPLGTLVNVPALPLVAGFAAQLNGAVTAATSTIPVIIDDNTRIPASGTALVDAELISWTSKTNTATGATLNSVTRAALGSIAVTHNDRVAVYEVLSIPTVTLNGALTAGATTIPVNDASLLPTAGTALIYDTPSAFEQFSWTGKSGNSLTGVTRGVNGTTAAAHASGLYVKWKAGAYRYVVGENKGNFKIQSVKNIKAKGFTTQTQPVVTLADTTLVTGRSFATIDFGEPNVNNNDGNNAIFDFQVNAALGATLKSSPAFLQTNVGTAPLNAGIGTMTLLPEVTSEAVPTSVTRSVTCSAACVNAGGFQSTIIFTRNGPLGVGAEVGRVSVTVTQNVTYAVSASYSTQQSIAPESFYVNITGQGFWVAAVSGYSANTGAGSGGNSSAAAVIGAITCDVQGIQDDGSGSISGTPSLLLENNADVAAFVVTQCYPSIALGTSPGAANSDLGSTWTTTRTSIAGAGYKLALMLGIDGLVKFTDARNKLGEQSRSIMFTEAGKLEFRYMPSAPAADETFDWRKDVRQDKPFTVGRTPANQIINDLWLQAGRSYAPTPAGVIQIFPQGPGGAQSQYAFVQHVQDLTTFPNPITRTITADYVQDSATATALANFWLGKWKRPRFTLKGTVYWNGMTIDKGDHVAVSNHPVLANQGDVSLIFEVREKHYIGGHEVGCIEITGVEANA